MRNSSLLKLMSLLFIVALFAACSGNSEQKDESFDSSYQPPAPSTNIGSSVMDNPEENSHYICVDRCKGSGSDQSGTCPICGKEYIHNDDFHKNEPAPQISLDPSKPNSQTFDPSNLPPPPTATQLSPQELDALKAKGPEYTAHYTCPSHCKGSGGDQPGSCPKCGTEYVHNDVYHQITGM